MDRPKGKVVFLNGGGGVLGRASALLFAQEGARISVVDMVKDKADETEQLIPEAALSLASDAASWLTGQAMVLDGGISCNYFTIS